MIDTHSHINMLENPQKAIMDAIDAEVENIVVPSAGESDFEDIIELARFYDGVYGALGVHPENVLEYKKDVFKDICSLTKANDKLIAIGEIGLDYYYGKETKEKQTELFSIQLELALSLDLPVIIHSRDANKDTYDILKKYGIKRAILHCFSGSAEFALKCIEEGWLLGIGGIITFKNAKKMKDVVKNVPLEYLVLETDAPYLTPHPFRGEENSPKYLKFIAKEIANIKDTTFEHVDIVTTETAKRFFNI